MNNYEMILDQLPDRCINNLQKEININLALLFQDLDNIKVNFQPKIDKLQFEFKYIKVRFNYRTAQSNWYRQFGISIFDAIEGFRALFAALHSGKQAAILFYNASKNLQNVFENSEDNCQNHFKKYGKNIIEEINEKI